MDRTVASHAAVLGSIPLGGEIPFALCALPIQEIVIAAMKKIEIV